MGLKTRVLKIALFQPPPTSLFYQKILHNYPEQEVKLEI